MASMIGTFYNKSGEVLWIRTTSKSPEFAEQQLRNMDWWPEVHRITWLPIQGDVSAVRDKAIQQARPKYHPAYHDRKNLS